MEITNEMLRGAYRIMEAIVVIVLCFIFLVLLTPLLVVAFAQWIWEAWRK
jgi:hypothetical protein